MKTQWINVEEGIKRGVLVNELLTIPTQAYWDQQAAAVRAFAAAVLHGDDAHRQWLLDAAEGFISTQLPLVQIQVADSTAEK